MPLNWTFDEQMNTAEGAGALYTARTQIAKDTPAALLDAAERIVTHGHAMVVEDETFVYDPDGGWARVYPSRCPHCFLSDDLCAHKLAAWLVKQLAEADQNAETNDTPAPFRTDNSRASSGGGYLGGIGPGYSGGRRTYSSGRSKKTCADCTRCGFYRNGSCNNPNKRAGRGRR